MKTKIENLAIKILIPIGILVLGIAGVLMFGSMFYFQTEAGYIYHYQNTITGKEAMFDRQGVHLKMPGFSKIEPYKKVFTLMYTGSDLQNIAKKLTNDGNTKNSTAMQVLFADTYRADIPGTFRFRLPVEREKFLKIHNDFRSFDNLVIALLDKTATDVVVNTATQYTGEEFLLGALNQFKNSVMDQLQNGIYHTERKQVEVEETSLAAVGLGQEDSNKLRKTKKLVWKTIPIKGRDGQFVRQQNPLEMYGIECTQFTMDRPIPEQMLQTLLTDKKKLVAERIRTVQEQETAKEQAKTEQLKAEIERTRAKQQALKKKELAVIAMQQQVEEAEKRADKERLDYNKQKDLALIEKQKELEMAEADRKRVAIEKQKELEIAQANLDIQKANFQSAQYEAKATKELGLAEAAVIQAKYDAYNREIYSQEIQKEIALAMYRNLADFKVQMPENMVISGEGQGEQLPSNLSLLTNFAAFNMMKGLQEKSGNADE